MTVGNNSIFPWRTTIFPANKSKVNHDYEQRSERARTLYNLFPQLPTFCENVYKYQMFTKLYFLNFSASLYCLLSMYLPSSKSAYWSTNNYFFTCVYQSTIIYSCQSMCLFLLTYLSIYLSVSTFIFICGSVTEVYQPN